MKQKGGTNKIFDCCFTLKKGEYMCATAGSKHISFWNPSNNFAKKGIFAGVGEATSMACVAYDENGVCYSGGCNSKIYVWNERQLRKTIAVHKGGFICAIKCVNGKIYSGGKDGNVCITSTDSH
jgi:WD40 repeat protein